MCYLNLPTVGFFIYFIANGNTFYITIHNTNIFYSYRYGSVQYLVVDPITYSVVPHLST